MRKLRKPLSWLLAVCMLFSLLPGTALAADPGSTTADTSTLTSWQDVFGVGADQHLSTKDIGRIWTDKTVSTEDIVLSGDIGQDVTVSKETDADFLVGLSALGSAATIVDKASVPVDTVFILDMSPKMGDPDAKAEAMLTATESAIRTLMAANPNNRVAVIGYSDYASVLLPLDHYQNGAQADYFNYDPNTIGTGGKVTAYGINSSTNPVENTFDIDRQSSGTDKYTQSGIYLGAQQLLNADTTVRVGGAQVDRAPQIILLSEGEPKDGDTNITAPPTTNSNNIQKFVVGDGAGSDESRHAQSFAMMMTAAYMKGQVEDHYSSSASFITIGVDPGSADAPNLARLCLNPKEELSSNTHANDFNNYFNEYKTNTSVDIMRYGGGASRTDRVTFNDFPASVTSLAYNDAYYEVSDVGDSTAWESIFEEIANSILTSAPQYPTETPEGADGTGGEKGTLVFTDKLGAYMKVTGTPRLVFANQQFEGKTTDGGKTYIFEGSIDANEIYPGAASLEYMTLEVSTDQNGQQTLTWTIPAALLPLRTLTATSSTDSTGVTSHTIQQDRGAYPIRLFYSVDRDETVTFDQDDNDYLIAHSKDGTTSFYSNAWDAAAKDDAQYGTATAVFTPADSNAFYHYTEDTPLYVLVDNVAGGNQKLLTHQEALDHLLQSTVIPERGTVVINGTTYNIVRAKDEHKGKGAAFFYEHRYYQAQGTGDAGVLEADLLTDYHLVLNPQALIGHTDGDADALYIKAGSAKLSRVSDGSADKTSNVTGTAVHYRHPVYNVDDTTVTVRLGNNGLRTEKTPTGTLTVKVNGDIADADPDQEFTYTLGLYNASSNNQGAVDPLDGKYSITIDSSSVEIQNGGIFKLKAGQTATISGLPVGTPYQITEDSPPEYTPSYTNGDSEFTGQSYGVIRYVQGETDPQASLTITYAYDPTASSYTLSYNANERTWGTPANMPGNETVTGGEVTLSSQVPTITLNEARKKAVFVGWTETAVDKIYSVGDTLDSSTVYAAGEKYTISQNTTLYAAWGYDTDGDGKPDVTEDKRTVTYNANGGTFGSEGTTEKTETGLNDEDRHTLKSTDEYHPSHADQDGHKVLFIGWTTDTSAQNKVYKRGDTPPKTSTRLTIDGDMTVYAVWGLDGDDDGKPDVTEDDHHITATAGDNGSISPNEAYVANGNNATFTITPGADYAVDTITIDADEAGEQVLTNNGGSLPTGVAEKWASYTFSNVTEDHTISVTFGLDEDDNGVPDANEPEAAYTLTYHANGGAFDDGKDTLEVKDLSGTYQLRDKAPTHDPVDLDGTSVPVLFIGWMTKDNQGTIYSVEDTAPYTVTSVSMDEDKAVWAAWGYDEDGNGEPDVTETQYTVTARVEGEGGSIDPTSKTVNAGEDVEFTIDAKDGYALDTIQVNGKTEYTNDDITAPFEGTWTLENVQEAAEVVVTFGEDENDNGVPDDKEEPEEEQYTVTASSDNEEQGSIDPTEATVDAGDDLPFTIHAEDGCALDYITVNGDVVYSNNDPENAFTGSWTLEDIREDSEVVAYFAADEDEDGVPDEPSYWTIEASAGSGGGIDPEGDVFVPDGGDQRFDFDPDRGYEIDRVRVDGDSERVRSSYTFEEVTENHTIRVTFTETDEGGDDDDDDDDDGGITYLTITATAGEGGSISPDGRVQVAYDRNKSFIIQADEGYELADVLVDGRSVGAVGRYTFEKVHKNHTITAVFTASQKLNGVDRWLNTRDHIAYLSGYPDGTFGPDRNMTRAEVAQMFYALLNDQNVPATVSFSDVPDGAWYADAVETLASLGMFTGYPDGTFHPNSTITRAEFAAAALSFADMASSARCSFPDVSAQDWFYPYVASAAEYGWIGGYPDGTFRPSGSITRAEVAVIVNHMLGRTPDQSFVDRSLDRLVSFSDLNSSHWAFYPIMEASNSHDHIKAGGSEQWTGINN